MTLLITNKLSVQYASSNRNKFCRHATETTKGNYKKMMDTDRMYRCHVEITAIYKTYRSGTHHLVNCYSKTMQIRDHL